MEFERQQQVEAEKENVEPVTHGQNVNLSENKQEVVNEEEIPNFARSLPSTPGIENQKYTVTLISTSVWNSLLDRFPFLSDNKIVSSLAKGLNES